MALTRQARVRAQGWSSVRLEQVSKEFEGVRGDTYTALRDVTIEVRRGDFYCLLGPSGCGSNAPNGSLNIVAGSGGASAVNPKPSWQSVVGNPSDGVRDTPDISLFAADGLWSHYYVFCWSDTANGGAACTGDPSGWSGVGGTSFASPIMAGIQALVNQRVGDRQGNPNPVYYQLAASEYGSSGNSSCNSTIGTGVASTCIFYDVTQGDIVGAVRRHAGRRHRARDLFQRRLDGAAGNTALGGG